MMEMIFLFLRAEVLISLEEAYFDVAPPKMCVGHLLPTLIQSAQAARFGKSVSGTDSSNTSLVNSTIFSSLRQLVSSDLTS